MWLEEWRFRRAELISWIIESLITLMIDSDFREGGNEICERRDNSSTRLSRLMVFHCMETVPIPILDKGERRSCSRRFPSRKNVIESTRNSYGIPLLYCSSTPRNAGKEYETEIEEFTPVDSGFTSLRRQLASETSAANSFLFFSIHVAYTYPKHTRAQYGIYLRHCACPRVLVIRYVWVSVLSYRYLTARSVLTQFLRSARRVESALLADRWDVETSITETIGHTVTPPCSAIGWLNWPAYIVIRITIGHVVKFIAIFKNRTRYIRLSEWLEQA